MGLPLDDLLGVLLELGEEVEEGVHGVLSEELSVLVHGDAHAAKDNLNFFIKRTTPAFLYIY